VSKLREVNSVRDEPGSTWLLRPRVVYTGRSYDEFKHRQFH